MHDYDNKDFFTLIFLIPLAASLEIKGFKVLCPHLERIKKFSFI